MARISYFELCAVDLPFRKPFKHAAAERNSSYSLFLKCQTDTGAVGYGECLPREYVTGETRDGAFELLEKTILPKLLNREFASFEAVQDFLRGCDGKAPADWVDPEVRQLAAWCAVDLALLDAFGRVFNLPLRLGEGHSFPGTVRYSPVIASDVGPKLIKTLLKIRLFGIRQVKLKFEGDNPEHGARFTRRILGRHCDIRADANMAWDVEQALSTMRLLSTYGIRSYEQPIAAEDIDGLARLTKESGLDVMVDESITDKQSLDRLISSKACTAINVRISKCGGFMAALARSREALDAGLKVQVGCQVGESSLLSAAQMILMAAVQDVTYAEGCFGLLLLREDPAAPMLQFGYGGRPPQMPAGGGLGMEINKSVLKRWTSRHTIIGKPG